MQNKTSQNYEIGVESKWKGTFRAGGVSSIGTGVSFFIALIAISLFGTGPPGSMNIQLTSIGAHPTFWLLAYGALITGAILSIPCLFSIYLALKNTGRAITTTAVGIMAFAMPVYIVGPVQALTLVSLGNLYNSSTGATQTAILAVASETISSWQILQGIGVLIAAVGIILLSVVLVNNPFFGKALGFLGFATGILTFPSFDSSIFLALATVLFGIWFIAIGWKLIKAGSVRRN